MKNKQKGFIAALVISLTVLIVGVGVFVVMKKSAGKRAGEPVVNQLLGAEVPNFIQNDEIKKVTLINGRYEEGGDSYITLDADRKNVAYGDVNEDGLTDIIATVNYNTGGTGHFYN